MLLNGGMAGGGGGGAASTARSGLRPLSGGGGNDENSVSEGLRNKNLGVGVGGNNGGGSGTTANKMALGPKSLTLDDSGSMNTGSKTPGPSQARRRAFGDISNRKAAKSVSFQNAKTPGRGARSTKKHSSVSQQQRTPFSVRNGNGGTNNNSTRKKTPYATTGGRSVGFGGPSSTAKKPDAVLPMDRLSSTSSAVAATKDPSLDVSDDDISDVELPAGGGIWDPMDFFDDERNGRDRSGSFEFYRGINEEAKAYRADVRERNQREFEKAVDEAEHQAKRNAERIAQEDLDFVMQGMDSLLNDLDDDANIDLCNDPILHPPVDSETFRRPSDDDFAI